MKFSFEKCKQKWNNIKLYKKLFLLYFVITFFGSFLLILPISKQSSADITYLDALFTAASAFSDTGLVSKTTAETWTYFGQFIIGTLIAIGGFGLIAIKVYIFNIIIGSPIKHETSEILSNERGSHIVGNTKNLIKHSFSLIIIVFIVFSIILSFYFFNVKPTDAEGIYENPYGKVHTSIRFGIFHSLSSINNAGFDIIGKNSLAPYYSNYALQFSFIFLFVLGGIGYPVIYEMINYFKSKFLRKKFKFTLFFKISMISYFIIALIGLALTFAIETTNESQDGFWNNASFGSKKDKTIALIFNTMSTRNAGFSTINLKKLTSTTLLIYSILMFIGSAPSSTAGGIRTTTIAILFLILWNKIRNKEGVNIFKRKLPRSTLITATCVFFISLILVIFSSIIMTWSFSNHGGSISKENSKFIYVFFESASAFGTTGLSTGITQNLNIVSKLFLIVLMFIGQLGVSSTIFAIQKNSSSNQKISYIEEDIKIG